MSGRILLFMILGAALGGVLSQEVWLALVLAGALIGYLLHANLLLNERIRKLGQSADGQAVSSAATMEHEAPQTPVTASARRVESGGESLDRLAPAATPPTPTQSTAAAAEPIPRPWSETALGRYLKAFFTDGNVLVRIGILILFVGVGFLLKLAAEHSLFPIEFRFAAVFVAALAMFVVGWRLRVRRRTFSLLIQGGAVGMMYLTIFAAAKIYTLFPLPLALVVMVVLIVASSLLAVLQDAKGLALFAAAGGFLAPILTSSGGGSHIVLFSYYVLLNGGILYIAWHKSWRELNLEGYLFTFGIGSLWGSRAYVPELFASTEPFLITFFLMFVAITVLFARRQAPRLTHYVDGTLVFGVPITAFALQALMLHEHPFGLSMSALVLALFYTVLALWLWRRHLQQLRLLVESFLAIAVAFVTLAIPLALDGKVTAAAWALEGAGLVWVGIRQRRALALFSGSALQLVAGVLFANEAMVLDYPDWPFLNGYYLGSLLIAVASLFSAQYIRRHGEPAMMANLRIDLVLFLWGLLWWYGGMLHELAGPHRLLGLGFGHGLLLGIAASAWLSHWLAGRLAWDTLAVSLRAYIPVLAAWTLMLAVAANGHLLAHRGYLVLPLVFLIAYTILRREESQWPAGFTASQHMIITWWLVAALAYQLDWWVSVAMDLPVAWATIVWGLLPGAAAAAIIRAVERIHWPFAQHREVYLRQVVSPLMLFTWLWALYSIGKPADPHPLPYISVLNPLELVSLAVLLMGLRWLLLLKRQQWQQALWLTRQQLFTLLAVAGFLWLNSVIARSIHFYQHVAYTPRALFDSLVFQMSISILWTLLALGLTYMAHRLVNRRIWITGVSLLAVVVLKLFFVELANSGTVERIVSFITVGVLMLVIGYVAPIPPREHVENESAG